MSVSNKETTARPDQASIRKTAKKTYQTPLLNTYGTITDLTAAGSGPTAERMSGQGKPNARP